VTGAAAGVLMLCCHLGDPDSNPLSCRQFHALRRIISLLPAEHETQSPELELSTLTRMGLSPSASHRILRLLERQPALDRYLSRVDFDLAIVTRAQEEYPRVLEQRLKDSAPPVLFCRGDISLLQTPCVSLVGSRNLREAGRKFAEAVGKAAAKEGFTLVSGGAAGADRAAQEACRSAGGRVIVFTPDSLRTRTPQDGVLYCSEGGYDEEFSSHRALGRNRLIHALGERTYVAQCDAERGGTWRGSSENLRCGWSPLFVHRDGTPGTEALIARGAVGVSSPAFLTGDGASQMSFPL